MAIKYIVGVILLALSIAACRQPMKNPHLADPIYASIKKDLDDTRARIASAQKDSEKARATMENAPIRTGQREDAQDAYFEGEHKLQLLNEKFRYLSLKLESQFTNDQSSYRRAFDEKKPWPNPDELSAHFSLERQIRAPKDWDPNYRIQLKRKPASKTHAAE